MLQEGESPGCRARGWCEPICRSPLLTLESPYTGENQMIHPMATPTPSPAFHPQIGPPLVTYVLPPPGGEGHMLLQSRREIAQGSPA